MNTTKNITEREIGFNEGIKYMKEKMLSVCDTDKPIEIDGKAYFVQSDKEHLHKLFNDIETKHIQHRRKGVKS